MIGQTIAHYRVTAKLGEGGMGAVYRATDTKLDREVAIKVLPPSVAGDPDRMARFTREAKVLASLNHPHIAAIYGVEDRALVMELVEGQTLRGPLPAETAIEYARQISDALDYAHEKGVIHRDLKPGNIMINADGVVKVLDFGLAKVMHPEAAPPDEATLTMRATEAGLVLGTAGYMSPEQARGQAVDKRSDIWAFGVVLFEMLTGKRMFEGETVGDLLAAVLKNDINWTLLPRQTPANVRRLLERCLERDKKKRLRDLGDAWMEPGETPAAEQRMHALPWIVAAAMTLAAGVAVALLFTRPAPAPPLTARFVISTPGQSLRPGVAISPDGRLLAYSARGSGSEGIFLRDLNQHQPRLLAGTSGATLPMFSPDGTSIAFFQELKLARLNLSGGTPVVVSTGYPALGATWTPRGFLMAAEQYSGVHRIPEAGGTPELMFKAEDRLPHAFPSLLPDGKALLFRVGSTTSGKVVVQRLGSSEHQTLVEGDNPRYSPTGHLIYLNHGDLMAAPFDSQQLRLSGPAIPMGSRVQGYDFSDNGSLLYQSGEGGQAARELVWLDAKGAQQRTVPLSLSFSQMNVSPDGKKAILGMAGADTDVWSLDFNRAAVTRLTFEPGEDEAPIWSPDGKRFAYSSGFGQSRTISIRAADGSGPGEQIWKGAGHVHLNSWSPDGNEILFDSLGAMARDLWVISLKGNKTAKVFLNTQFDEGDAAFSPDGKWVVYSSNESGRGEVYVRPYPGPGAKYPVSINGGAVARWSPDGRQLFYREGRKLMSAPIEYRPEFRAGVPKAMFEMEENALIRPLPGVSGFVALQQRSSANTRELHVVLNWFEELKRMAGNRK